MKNYDFSRLNVLIVEDNAYMQSILRRLLHAFGIASRVECSDGQEAWYAIKRFSPDIILLDWNMEPMDGITFARKIRQDAESPNPFVPIIMISGYSEQDRIMTARDAGITEYLIKPVSARSLYERFVSIVDNPRQFVRSPNYVGPCRRRHSDASYSGPERRKDARPGAEQSGDGRPADAARAKEAVGAT